MLHQIAQSFSNQFSLSSLTWDMAVVFALEAVAFTALLRFVLAGLEIRGNNRYWLAMPPAFFVVILGVWSALPSASVDPTVPDLRLKLRLSSVDVPKLNSTFVSVIATVRNDGQPTRIGSYPLILTNPGTPSLVGTPQNIPLSGIQLGGEWLCGADSLDRHVEEIKRGSKVEGRLLYYFKGVRADTLKAPGTMMTLVVTDASGKPWSVSAPVDSQSVDSEIRSLPALQLEAPRAAQPRSALTAPVATPCVAKT